MLLLNMHSVTKVYIYPRYCYSLSDFLFCEFIKINIPTLINITHKNTSHSTSLHVIRPNGNVSPNRTKTIPKILYTIFLLFKSISLRCLYG